MRLFRYINISRNVYKEIKKQKQYNKTFLVPYLHELENKYGGTFKNEQTTTDNKYLGSLITYF